MSKNENIPELTTETGDGDDVEILEVVGVDDGVDTPVPFGEAESGSEDGSDEYLLDLDDPALDPLADASEPTPPESGGNGGAADSDHERLLRLRADYANLMRRIERERTEFEVHANGDLVSRLLPVVDNLERALAANAARVART